LRYTYLNATAERLQAARREDLLGRDVRTVYPDAESYKTISPYERVLREQEPVTSTSYHAGFDRWVEIRAFPTPDGVSVFYKDVSAQVKAEQALRESNETLEQRVAERTAEVQRQSEQLRALAAELSRTELRERQRLAKLLHDNVQQLLVAGQMQLSLIKRGADPKIMQSTAQGVDGILAEALEASRSLTVELYPPILHQSGLVAALSWLAARTESKQQFKLHARIDSDAEPADPDVRTFLFEAIRELILNAVKHSGEREAHLTMVCTRDDGCKIIVEDKGRGFDPASVKPGPTGGFGMFSIQQRLLLMGGRMEIESAPGRGTRVVLTIPIGRSGGPATEAADLSSDGIRPGTAFVQKGQRISILLVDDHRIVREGLSMLLGFENDMEVVAEAEDGVEALEMARRHRPDVVIMDVNLPRMDGIEATRILTRELPGTQVIGLSMHIDAQAANAMRTAGAVAYLTKGGPSEGLIAAVRACARPEDRTPGGER
jgi:signal transduction histidine kinase/ActR/RegA family two-component response regulator